MPAMPRPSKKAQKAVEKIIGKPDNRQSHTRVLINPGRIDDGLRTGIDSMYNHTI